MRLSPTDNIDYNSLKHFIKANTTRDQAKAITIPGQPDTHLAKVEDELYNELCAQHDSAGLFVSAKADEITRRLRMPPPAFPSLSATHHWLSRHLLPHSPIRPTDSVLQNTSPARSNGSSHDVTTTPNECLVKGNADSSGLSAMFSSAATTYRTFNASSTHSPLLSERSLRNIGYESDPNALHTAHPLISRLEMDGREHLGQPIQR